MPRARILLATIAVLVVAGAAIWLVARPVTVATVAPIRGEAAEIVYATGVVEPRIWAKVTALARERIVELCNCEGDRIERGDVLARLDDSEAVATLSELEARRRLANSEHQRLLQLSDRQVTTERELDRALSELTQTEAQIARQKARLDTYVLRAPSDGIVLRQDGEVGEIAEPGTALFWVGRPKPLLVIADVNEEDIPRVAVGQRALLSSDAFPGRELEATVDSITPKGDPVAKTYRVRLALPDDTPLMIGMTVDVNIIVKVSKNALLVPSGAVRGDTVYVVEDGVARRRTIKAGIRGTTRIEVVSGLSEDARVIDPYPQEIEDGARVSVADG